MHKHLYNLPVPACLLHVPEKKCPNIICLFVTLLDVHVVVSGPLQNIHVLRDVIYFPKAMTKTCPPGVAQVLASWLARIFFASRDYN